MKQTLKARIDRLREEGNEIEIQHHRAVGRTQVNPRGGHTVAVIRTKNGLEIVGEANCSKLDNYNKNIGGLIALGRAEKRLSEIV